MENRDKLAKNMDDNDEIVQKMIENKEIRKVDAASKKKELV